MKIFKNKNAFQNSFFHEKASKRQKMTLFEKKF
jgi:hypothetical protein